MTRPLPKVASESPSLALNDLLADEAAWFAQRLRAIEGAKPHEVPDYALVAREKGTLAKPVSWTNVIVSTPLFRRAHVELFEIADMIAVLHVCIFPQPGMGLPIFGFDVVAGQSRATGGFLDMSVVDTVSARRSAHWASTFEAQRFAFAEPRGLPDWGDIFSPGVVAIRPTSPAEAQALFALGRASLEWLLALEASPGSLEDDRAGQRRYIERQRQNEHTFRMLKGCVGEDLARDFMDRWLFPDPA